MSFLKFKLDHVPPRAAPLPIASRASSTTPPGSPAFPPPPPRLSAPLAPSAPSAPASAPASFLPLAAPPAAAAAAAAPRGPASAPVPAPAPDDTKVPWSKRPATPPKAGELSFSLRSWKRIKTRQTTACAECKASKVRCERAAAAESGDACRRCLRLDKQCFFDSKPRTRSTTGKPPAHEEAASTERDKFVSRRSPDSLRTSGTEACSSLVHRLTRQPSSRPFPSIENKQLDIRIDSLISREVAQQVFYHFVNSVAPKCPLVVFAAGTPPEFVRETRPLLFLSILSVASSGYCSVEKQTELALESKRALADRAMVQRDKSLEIVQSLQVVCLWYRAIDGHKELKLAQLVQVTVTMAMGLGLDRLLQPVDDPQTLWDRAEGQRAWLGCFLLSASVSLLLRCPILMHWTPDMDVYMNDLRSGQACQSDVFLCELVRTEHICYSAHRELLSAHHGGPAFINNPDSTEMIRRLQSRIDEWAGRGGNELQRSLLDFSKCAASLFAHELVMHVGGDEDEFRAPFSVQSLQNCKCLTEQTDKERLSTFRRIIAASHGLLNTFLGLSLFDILSLSPHIYGGRVIYSLVLLCKLFRAIMQAPGEMRALIRIDDLRLGEYLNHLDHLAKALISHDERSALSRAFLVIDQLRRWYHMHRYQAPTSDSSPMAAIDSQSCRTSQGSSPRAALHHARGPQCFDSLAQQSKEEAYNPSMDPDPFGTEGGTKEGWFL